MKRPGMGYITQAPPPFPAFTLAHTAAQPTSDTHAPQRAYDGSEAHHSRAMVITLAAWITVSLCGSGQKKNPQPVKEAGFENVDGE